MVGDHQPILDAIQFLVSYLPADSRIIIASRVKPAIPLGRLRIQRMLLEIDTGDLKFTPEETASILAGCCSVPLTDTELKGWYKATEGWPVALMLSSLFLDDDHRLPVDVNPELFGDSGALAGYLAEEIWSGLDESIKQFMMYTSLPEIVDVDICDRALATIIPEIASMKIIHEMERRNLMVECLEERKSYRYNPIGRQFLYEKLVQSTPLAEIDEIHRLFGQAFADNENYDQAIAHFLESRSPDLAAAIIETHGDTILEAGRFDTLAKWLAGIPEAMRMKSPRLSYYSARTTERQGEMAEAERWYRLAGEGFENSADVQGSFSCALSMSEFYFMRNQHGKSLAKAAEALEWAGTPSEQVGALSRMALQNMLLGKGREALKLINRATGLCDESMGQTIFTLSVDALASEWFAGGFKDMHEAVIRLQRESDSRSPLIARYQILCWKVLTLYEMARYDEALEAIEEQGDYLGEEDQLQKLGFEFFRGIILLCLDDGREGYSILKEIDRKVGRTKALGPFYSANLPGCLLSPARQNGQGDRG